MLKRDENVLIIGGGLQGCAIALFLAKAGRDVTVIEKSIAGRHASSVNAGGLRLLLRDIREYPLAQRAMDMWDNLSDFVGADAAQRSEVCLNTSQIAVAFDSDEIDWCHARAKDMQSHGIFTEELISADELHQLLPGLSKAALGGMISRRDGHANPAHASLAFREAACAAGARLIENCSVTQLTQVAGGGWIADTSRGQFDASVVINCAGAWGAELAAKIGEDLPMHIYAPSMMVTARVKHFLTPVVLGIDRTLSFKQSAVGSLIIGGGISGKPCLADGTSYTVMDRMPAGAAAVIEAFPDLANVSVLRTWTGLEGRTSDGIPFIGPSSRHKGLWHVFGFSGHGFLLAPAVGEVVADSLVSGELDRRLIPFATDRFQKITSAVS